MRPSPVDPRLDQPPTSDLKARALIAAIPDPIFRIGTDGVYRGFKVDSEADLLTSPDDVLGHSIHERLPQDIADAVLAAGRRAVSENTLQNIQYTLDVRGEVREYEGRVVASGDDEFVLIVRDFTEIARQARALESERDFSRAVVRSTPSFLALVDEEGTLLGVNHALERAAGIPESAWVGTAFWTRFIADEDVERAKADFLRFHAGDPPGIVEYEHDAPDGRRLVVDWTATTIQDAEGRTRYLLCGLDVTARKDIEEEIRRSRARIVSASDAERKRLERNLHDGAQQNLVTVSHAVHLAARTLRTDPDAAEDHLERALVELNTAHEELRELARGLHPADPHGPRARRGGAVAREPGAHPRHGRHGRRGRAMAPARRERRVLRRLRGADERAQVRARDLATSASCRATTVLVVEVTDNGCGGASRRGLRARAVFATASRRSTASSRCTARRARAPASTPSSRSRSSPESRSAARTVTA